MANGGDVTRRLNIVMLTRFASVGGTSLFARETLNARTMMERAFKTPIPVAMMPRYAKGSAAETAFANRFQKANLTQNYMASERSLARTTNQFKQSSLYSASILRDAEAQVRQLERQKVLQKAIIDMQRGDIQMYRNRQGELALPTKGPRILGGRTAPQIITGLGRASTLPLAGTLLGLGYTVDQAMKFQTVMNQVRGHIQINNKEFKYMQASLLQVAAKTGASLDDLGYAYMRAVTHGDHFGKAMKDVWEGVKLGLPVGAQAADMVNSVTSAMKAFGSHDVKKVGNTLWLAAALGNTKVQDLMTAFPSVAPIAANLGGGDAMKQVLASSAALTQVGLPMSQTMTQIRNLLVRIANPTPKMNAAAYLLSQQSHTNVSEAFTAGFLRRYGLPGVMERVRIAEQRAQARGVPRDVVVQEALKLMPNLRGTTGLLSLTGRQFKTMIEDLRRLRGPQTNAVDAMFHRYLGTTAAQAKILREQFHVLAIEMGTVLLPVVNKVLKEMQGPMKGLMSFSKQHPGQLTKWALVTAGVLGLIKVVGLLVTPISLAVSGVKAFATGIRSVDKLIGYTSKELKAFEKLGPAARTAAGMYGGGVPKKEGLGSKALNWVGIAAIVPGVATMLSSLGMGGKKSEALSFGGLISGGLGMMGIKSPIPIRVINQLFSHWNPAFFAMAYTKSFVDLIRAAPKWAEGLQKAFGKGILAGAGYIKDTITRGIYNVIKDWIGWMSPSKKGGDPAKWGAAMVRSFGRGILSGAGQLKNDITTGIYNAIKKGIDPAKLGRELSRVFGGGHVGVNAAKWGASMARSFGRGILSGAAHIKDGVTRGIYNVIHDWIGWASRTKKGGDPSKWGAAMVRSFGKGVADQVPGLNLIIKSGVFGTIHDWIGWASASKKGGNPADWGKAMVMAFVQGILSPDTAVADAAKLVWHQVWVHIGGKVGDVVGWGGSVVLNFANGLGLHPDTLTNAAKNVWHTVWSHTGGKVGDALGWGLSTVTHLAMGMDSGDPKIKAAARKAYLTIHPKDFHDRGKAAGLAVSAGVANGIDKGSALIKAALKSTLSDIGTGIKEPSWALGPGSASSGGSPNKLLKNFIKYTDAYGHVAEQCTALVTKYLQHLHRTGDIPIAQFAYQWTRSMAYRPGTKGVKPGDVLVWHANGPEGIGGAGHVDIFYKFGRKGGQLGFWTYDANWGPGSNEGMGTAPKMVWHPLADLKAGVSGYLATPQATAASARTRFGTSAPRGVGGVAWGQVPSGVRAWSKQIERAANITGVPAALLASMMVQETGGNNTETSSSGAQGLMQFMPGTWAGFTGRLRKLGLSTNVWNPLANITAAGMYMKDLSAGGKGYYNALSGYSGGYAPSAYNDPVWARFKAWARKGGQGPPPGNYVPPKPPQDVFEATKAQYTKLLNHAKWQLWDVYRGQSPAKMTTSQFKGYEQLVKSIAFDSYKIAWSSLERRKETLKSQLASGSIDQTFYNKGMSIIASEELAKWRDYRKKVEETAKIGANMPLKRAIASLRWTLGNLRKDIAGEKPWTEGKRAQAAWLVNERKILKKQELIAIDDARLQFQEHNINSRQFWRRVGSAKKQYNRAMHNLDAQIPIAQLRHADKGLRARISELTKPWVGVKEWTLSKDKQQKWLKDEDKALALKAQVYDNDQKIAMLMGDISKETYKKLVKVEATWLKNMQASELYKLTHHGKGPPGLSRHPVPVHVTGHSNDPFCPWAKHRTKQADDHHKAAQRAAKERHQEMMGSWHHHLAGMVKNHQMTITAAHKLWSHPSTGFIRNWKAQEKKEDAAAAAVAGGREHRHAGHSRYATPGGGGQSHREFTAQNMHQMVKHLEKIVHNTGKAHVDPSQLHLDRQMLAALKRMGGGGQHGKGGGRRPYNGRASVMQGVPGGGQD